MIRSTFHKIAAFLMGPPPFVYPEGVEDFVAIMRRRRPVGLLKFLGLPEPTSIFGKIMMWIGMLFVAVVALVALYSVIMRTGGGYLFIFLVIAMVFFLQYLDRVFRGDPAKAIPRSWEQMFLEEKAPRTLFLNDVYMAGIRGKDIAWMLVREGENFRYTTRFLAYGIVGVPLILWIVAVYTQPGLASILALISSIAFASIFSAFNQVLLFQSLQTKLKTNCKTIIRTTLQEQLKQSYQFGKGEVLDKGAKIARHETKGCVRNLGGMVLIGGIIFAIMSLILAFAEEFMPSNYDSPKFFIIVFSALQIAILAFAIPYCVYHSKRVRARLDKEMDELATAIDDYFETYIHGK